MQTEREETERALAEETPDPTEERTHERRAERAAYLREKLGEQAESEQRVSVSDADIDGSPTSPSASARTCSPGRSSSLGGDIGQERLVRAIARAAYKHGAKFVDANYFDLYVKRERLLHAGEDTLDFVPSWYSQRLLAIGDQRCARIGLSGTAHPRRAPTASTRSARRATSSRSCARPRRSSTTARRTGRRSPARRAGGRELVFPDLEPAAAEDKLWEQMLHVLRLDEDDPIAAWQARADTLVEVAARG